jgi:Ca2+-binding EF-hand superfamily protein
LLTQWGNLQFKTTTDLKLKEAVDRIYLKYDIDHSGSLEPSEAAGAFNELMIELRIPATLNTQETLQLLQLVDRNKNGRIEKPEFFSCMKNLAGRDF